MARVSLQEELRKHREKSGMNQTEYWAKLGVTQSGGSRYENHIDMPESLNMLWGVVYGVSPLKALAKLRGCKVEELK